MNDPLPPRDLDRLLEAVSFAARRHRGQLRKDGATPYVAHPMRASLVLRLQFGVGDVDTLVAALLHDTIEDTTVDRDEVSEKFGEPVGEWVALLSKDKRLPEAVREARYHDVLAAAPLAVRLIKLADVYDNLGDGRALPAEARRRAVARARDLLDRLEPGWPAPQRGVLELLRQRIRAAEGEPPETASASASASAS